MIARAATPADAEAVRTFCSGSEIDPARDSIIVVEDAGVIVGVLAFREIIYVHSLTIGEAAKKRLIAEVALAYATGAARAMGQREALFTIDPQNQAMRRMIEAKGAKCQDGVTYTMEVR